MWRHHRCVKIHVNNFLNTFPCKLNLCRLEIKMCCCLFSCFSKLVEKPLVYAIISLLVAVAHTVFLIIVLLPYSHCELSEQFRHDYLKLYQVYNCSQIDSTVVDNCILLADTFDIRHVISAWIILNIILALSSIFLIVGICINLDCCVASLIVLPYILTNLFIIAFDIILLLIVISTYGTHGSYSYFVQMFGVQDSSSLAMFKETLQAPKVSMVTRTKLSNLFYRLLFHLVNIVFVLLAIKHFFSKMCGKNKPAE